MAPPRKTDFLPDELMDWLRTELKARGFGGYEAITEALNARLEEAGLELRIGKTAVHAFGHDFRDYARKQSEAQQQLRAFLNATSLKDEVDVTSALFQQLTSIMFHLNMILSDAENLPDPRGMKDLTTALKNLISSAALKDAILAKERELQGRKMDEAVAAGDIDAAAAQRAREIMGLA